MTRPDSSFRDHRAPRTTPRDPRWGYSAPWGIFVAAVVGIGLAFGGPTGAGVALGTVVAIAVAWAIWRGRRRRATS